jgi:hypothetical protein
MAISFQAGFLLQLKSVGSQVFIGIHPGDNTCSRDKFVEFFKQSPVENDCTPFA